MGRMTFNFRKMEIVTTFQTNNPQFLARQEALFNERQRTDRPAEVNYEWSARDGTLLSLFQKNTFLQGGWWEILDQGKVIKACGAYLYETSMIIGVRYYCFSKKSQHRFSFINYLLPEMHKKAQELGAESLVMTFNEYNKSFNRVFNIARQSDQVNVTSKQLLSQFVPAGPITFNHVDQRLLGCKLVSKRQWYESI